MHEPHHVIGLSWETLLSRAEQLIYVCFFLHYLFVLAGATYTYTLENTVVAFVLGILENQ